MNQLPIFVNLEGRKILLLGSGEMAEAKKLLYERAGAVITDDENAEGLTLAVVAMEDDDEAIAAVARLKARGLLVNAVDRSTLCDYTTPAIIDRDPVLIAIGTGGASAGLAKALRQRLEQLLPPASGHWRTACSMRANGYGRSGRMERRAGKRLMAHWNPTARWM
jgi:uroporphyrin-III C-methyltransferase/precorrin-2 dehydrogenase/sirohydrochlorin ferrochelatase